MKPNQTSNKKKLSLIKEKISSLSNNQMQNVVGGDAAAGTIGGETKSTVRNFTCTWCTHTSNSTDL